MIGRKYLGGTTHIDPYAYLASFGVLRANFKRDVQSGVEIIEPTTKSEARKNHEKIKANVE